MFATIYSTFIGRKTKISLFCYGNYVDDTSRVSLLYCAHTHLTAEGNVSRTLQAMVTDSVSSLTKEKWRDK